MRGGRVPFGSLNIHHPIKDTIQSQHILFFILYLGHQSQYIQIIFYPAYILYIFFQIF